MTCVCDGFILSLMMMTSRKGLQEPLGRGSLGMEASFYFCLEGSDDKKDVDIMT